MTGELAFGVDLDRILTEFAAEDGGEALQPRLIDLRQRGVESPKMIRFIDPVPRSMSNSVFAGSPFDGRYLIRN